MPRPNLLEFEKLISELENSIALTRAAAAREGKNVEAEVTQLEREHETIRRQYFTELTPWDEVLLARHASRPYTLDYLPLLTEDFLELHGDRLFGDDGALVGGFALLAGVPVMIMGQQKGRDLKERQKRNFGYMRPEGYRKALRLMHLAAKFRRPVVTLVDTAGADPNVSSEERGISESIARNLREMSVLKTPIISLIIGEGGSGGALGIAVADRVLMLEHSIYSVIAPEGCAAIIWRDPQRGADAARAMRVTARDALSLGLVDEIIPEPLGGAHRGVEETAASVREALARNLRDLMDVPPAALLEFRYDKLRALGRFTESAAVVMESEAQLAQR